MKNFTLTLLILIASFSVKGQSYVTIPDSNFVTWLTINIPSAMMGNQMDTSNAAVTSLISMDLSNDSIFDIRGIQYFSSLQNLDCSYNYIDSIFLFPDSIRTLICTNNYLAYLPTLPDSLQMFRCDRNNLTWLPSLPVSITDFTCSQNQLDTLPALPPFLPDLICSYNLLTSLPPLPNSILIIECETNELDTLPALPSSLISLNCQNNILTSLPALPTTLTSLICNINQLTSLPALPSSLITLECYQNMLTSLPALPASLISLTCSNNPLGMLPALPASLETLKCYSDSLTVLPTLPSSLTYLDCNSNFLTVFPALPGLLAYMDCSNNLLPTIPALPSSLTFLNCSANQITVLPGLSSLEALYCDGNLLSVLPVIPGTLQTLSCASNPLNNLPALASLLYLNCSNATLDSLPVLPNSLLTLSCDGNFLDSLPALPASLNYLNCDNNQLILLPALNALNSLSCNGNQLTALPIIPASLATLTCVNNLITCFPEFPNSMMSLSLYSNPFSCLQNYIPAMDTITLSYPLCVLGDLVNNPNNCPSARGLVGFVYTDANSNCAKDSTDGNLINIPVKVYDSLGNLLEQTYTASNGVYNFAEPAGTYTAVIDTTNIPFIPQCNYPGIDSTVTTSIATPLIENINFDFNCKPGFDIGVQSVMNYGQPFPGQTHDLRIVAGDMTQWYNMACASGISGVVQIKVTGPVSYVGIVPGALSPVITGSVYTYSISDFGAITNTSAFGLQFFTDTTAAAGDNICVTVSVTPIGGDNDTLNNIHNYCYTVVNSHDPNYKETTPDVVSPDYSDYFTYNVHFQNTGNAAAINIYVMDTLDSNLDFSTFQLINYSHANITTLTGNALRVSFPNIMLADSTSSADSSQGFFQYRIKAKPARPLGTHIHNTAYIYFDYNTPVITNTTLNLYRGIGAGINESAEAKELDIYPNPASEFITIRFNSSSKNSDVKIYDATGRLVKEFDNVNSGENNISITELEKGLYLINVNDGKTSTTKRFVKQ